MGTRRNTWVVVVTVGSVAAVGASFALGTLVSSPWEEAVSNSERTPLVLVPVEHRALTADVSEAQGKYSAGTEYPVLAATTDVSAVVTAQKVDVGQPVTSGTVLSEVSGRPVIALGLPFSLYRDIAPGDRGPDVAAVQESLRDLGAFRGRVDGIYGTATSSAVAAFWSARGYDVPVDAELQTAVDDARKALDAATRARDAAVRVAAASTAMPDAPIGDAPAPLAAARPEPSAADVSGSGTAEVEVAVSTAEEALEKARFAALPRVRLSEVAFLPPGDVTVVSAAPVGAILSGSVDTDTDKKAPAVGTGAGSVVVLRSGNPSATFRVGMTSKEAFAPGAAVEARSILDQAAVAGGHVLQVGDFQEGGEQVPGYDVLIAFDGPSPFADGDTLSVRSAAQAAVKAEGLSVPLIALREDESGTFITIADRGRVGVTVDATGAGYAVVKGDGIVEGDDVVVSGEPPRDEVR